LLEQDDKMELIKFLDRRIDEQREADARRNAGPSAGRTARKSGGESTARKHKKATPSILKGLITEDKLKAQKERGPRPAADAGQGNLTESGRPAFTYRNQLVQDARQLREMSGGVPQLYRRSTHRMWSPLRLTEKDVEQALTKGLHGALKKAEDRLTKERRAGAG